MNLVALTPLLERFEREIGTLKTLLLVLGRMQPTLPFIVEHETNTTG